MTLAQMTPEEIQQAGFTITHKPHDDANGGEHR
jgi:hypothetical protein